MLLLQQCAANRGTCTVVSISVHGCRCQCVTRALQREDAVAEPYAAGMLELAQEREIMNEVYNDMMGLQVLLLPPC